MFSASGRLLYLVWVGFLIVLLVCVFCDCSLLLNGYSGVCFDRLIVC